MIAAGIDVGARTTKIVILKDGSTVYKNKVLTRTRRGESAEQAWAQALKATGLKFDDIQRIVATGSGRTNPATHAHDQASEFAAAAKGARYLDSKARTVVDVGAEEGRGVRLDAEGMVRDFVVNEKCAAAAGSFTESMSRVLGISLEELGALSLKSTNMVPVNAQCAVFAESEVASLLQAETPKEDIARAIHDSIAGRIGSLVRRMGIQDDVVLVGGMAKDPGFVDALRRALETNIVVPQDPEFVPALGAALIACIGSSPAVDTPQPHTV